MPARITVHIYPTDCDVLGHVNHATMITLLEHARWALTEPQLSYAELARGDVWTVVRHVDIGYTAQALPGDDLVIRSGIVRVGTTSFTVRQDVTRERDGARVAEATIVFVCIGRDGKSVPVPDVWRGIFPAWEEP